MAKLRTLERSAWLERARDAKSDEDLLVNLLGAWRAQPHAAIAELVAAAGERSKIGKLDHDAWLALAAKQEPSSLGGLLANLQTGRLATARERAEVLAKWPPDPRIAPALLAMIPRSQLRGRSTRPFWTAVFRIVHRQFHPGIAGAVAQIDAARMDDDFGDYVDAKLRTLRQRLEGAKAEPLDAASQAIVDALTKRLAIVETRTAQKSVDDFIADIWANPLDDGLREVFADWLEDDPRAELIMLQMTRKRQGFVADRWEREVALLKKHARDWMGPLEPVVDKKQFRFEGGFLYACKVDGRQLARIPALMTHPAWSTVREYELLSFHDSACDKFLDHMIALGAKRT